ncbi:hypothetical protein [Janthinobacterium sp. B9-8]|uniref:hypothetical protein n=1 Tax=Janthinobacterium sp. B9-8 TaxID=1236179 RepID=UPI00061CEB70|nr:hypothetical protein [Janthinobacterium sp. B9-8]AMC35358.1 hypothetical protein VN23_12425 [Janthinobacterium sp. B9-8]
MENGVNTIGTLLGWSDLGLFALLITFLQYIIACWLKSRIQYSIKNEYDRKLEQLKVDLNFSVKKREEAALVAELLAEWISQPEDRKILNKLLWEASLWLPDEETLALNNLLAHEGNITTKQMLIKIRKIIQNGETSITAEDLTSFAKKPSTDHG